MQESRFDMPEVKGKPVVTTLVTEVLTLEMLLAGVTDDNLHHEIYTGDAVGNEAW